MSQTPSNLLMISDAFLDTGSGATAARLVAAAWQQLGFDVTVFAPVGKGLPPVEGTNVRSFVPKPSFRTVQHFKRCETVDIFQDLLHELAPQIIFFLGTVYSNPVQVLKAAVRSGSHTSFMTWNQSFYCARSYAFLADAPCSRCNRGNYIPALRQGCARIPSWLTGSAARWQIRDVLTEFDTLLCSSKDQMARLVEYGISHDRIHLCALPFEKSRLEGIPIQDGEYFIYYAQPADAKGWHILPQIIESTPDARFVLCPMSDLQTCLAQAPGLQKLIDNQRVVLHTDVSWSSGLPELLGRARGVVIPSVWPTTTEYVLLEGLGLGKPIVAFDVGVHQEVLQHGVNAMVAPVPDATAFAQAINVLNEDATLRRAIGIEAKKLYDRLTDENAVLSALRKAIL